MTELRVSFTLRERDVEHLRWLMRRVGSDAAKLDETQIVDAVDDMVRRIRSTQVPDYVLERAGKLEELVQMVRDPEWDIPADVRERVVGALAYFAKPNDLIPDGVPGLGFLDDAIMIELVVRDLAHELAGYETFRRTRQTASVRIRGHVASDEPSAELSERIATERERQRARIREREAKAREGRRLLW
jgi:uncharacterized membrane protein YkvA (DUF1232 family)